MNIFCSNCAHVHDASADCPVPWMELHSPEGREAVRERYRQEVQARNQLSDVGPLPGETSRRLAKMGFPDDAITGSANPTETGAAKAAKRFIRDRDAVFLLLLGSVGIGKTTAAAMVARHVADRFPWNSQSTMAGIPEPIGYLPAATVTKLSAFDRDDQDQVESLKHQLLVVLDDAGDEGTNLSQGHIAEILFERHAKRRRTVIAANLTGPSFTERYGEAVAERVKQLGHVPNLANEKSLRERRKAVGM